MSLRSILLVAAIAVLALTPALAQQAGQQQPPQQQQQQQKQEVEGEVSSLDKQNQTLTVGGLMGIGGTTLQVTDQTRFEPGPGAEGARDFQALSEGDRIRATYSKRGDQNIAEQIIVLSPSAGGQQQQQPGGQGGAPSGGSQ